MLTLTSAWKFENVFNLIYLLNKGRVEKNRVSDKSFSKYLDNLSVSVVTSLNIYSPSLDYTFQYEPFLLQVTSVKCSNQEHM